MQFQLKGTCILNLEHVKGAPKSRINSTDYNIDLSPNLDKSRYFDEKGYPNKEGIRAATLIFVHALIANIHYAHQKNYIDSAKHLRYIISELETGFIAVADFKEGEFKDL